MANEGNLKPYAKGQSGNPDGRPPIPAALRESRRLNRDELERALNRLMSLTRGELEAASKDPATSALELMLVSTIREAIKRGDQTRVNFLLDRLVGKVVEKVDVASPGVGHAAIMAFIEERRAVDAAETNAP